MKLVFGIISVMCCLNLVGQQQKIDSVLKLLVRYPKQDTAMLSRLRWLSFYYQDVDMDKGIRIADSAIAIANKLGEKGRYLAGLYNSRGVNYWAKGENNKALSSYAIADKIFTEQKDKRGIANVRSNISNALINLGFYDSATIYLKDVVRVYSEIGDKEKEAGTYNSLGVVYLYILNLPKALESFYKVRLYAVNSGDKASLAAASTNIGIVNEKLGKYDKALEYYNEALSIYINSKGLQSVADMQVNIASAYYNLNDLNKALLYYQQAVETCKKTGNKSTISACYQNMARVYSDLGNYDQAMNFVKQGIHLFNEMGNTDVDGYNVLSRVILKANNQVLNKYGFPVKHKYDSAIRYAQLSLDLATENKTIDNAIYAWQNLSEIYEEQKKYDKALFAYKQYSQLKDSVYKDEQKETITKHEMQFEFDKEKLLISLKNERERQVLQQNELRNKLIIISTSVILIIISVFYILYKRKKNKAEVAEAEMSMLRAQMKPHFIFNALNSINSYGIEKGASADMRNYISKFAKLMRSVLNASIQKYIPLSQDIEILTLYLQLEMKRANGKFNFEVIIDPMVDKEVTVVPPMLMQPFVENSIWHGFSTIHSGGFIEIRVSKYNDKLTCVIKDNGIGRKNAAAIRTTEQKSSHDSQGLKITRRRIELLNLENSTRSNMEIFDLEQGTSVEINLPYKEILEYDTNYYSR